MENIEELIESEVQEFLKKYPYFSRSRFLNNFFMHLPDDKFKNGGFYRRLYDEEEWKTYL